MASDTEDVELHQKWYEIIDDHVYWINRYGQRNQRKEREARIHDLANLVQQEANRQKLELLDRLEAKQAYDPSGTTPVINPREIEAERKHLERR